jgi:hypothetical protein
MDDSLIKELSPEKLYLNTRCSEKEVDPFQIPVQQLADFLAEWKSSELVDSVVPNKPKVSAV